MTAKRCLECGRQNFGRSDKKFCSSYCRTSYHNKQNSELHFVRSINIILKRNRKILASFNPQKISKIPRTELQIAGFNWDYFTNTHQTKSGKTYYFCYDYGYLPIFEEDQVLLIKEKL